MRTASIPGFARLTTPEKILLLEELWDSIASEPDQVPVPCSHRLELDRRMARHLASPGQLLTLAELQERVAKGRR